MARKRKKKMTLAEAEFEDLKRDTPSPTSTLLESLDIVVREISEATEPAVKFAEKKDLGLVGSGKRAARAAEITEQGVGILKELSRPAPDRDSVARIASRNRIRREILGEHS